MPTMQFEINIDPVAQAGAIDALATVIAAGATVRLTAVVTDAAVVGGASAPTPDPTPAMVGGASAPTRAPAKRRKPTGPTPHVCPLCGDSFTLPNGLTRHLNNHRRAGDVVPVGGASAPTGASATAAGEPPALPGADEGVRAPETTRVHVTGGSYTCPICAKKLDSQANLGRHMGMSHRQRPMTADPPERDLVADALGGC